MKRNAIYTKLFIIIGIFVLLNALSNRMFFRLDFTADQRYTLSNATKDILASLESPITVKAYFSENLPPNIDKTRKDFREQLIEFSNCSNGNLVYEFINPSEDDQSEMKAQQQGISPILVNIRERDQMKQQRAYLGAVVHLGENKEVIPVIQPGAAMEYSLATTIKKLSVTEKPKLALLQGHGEPKKAALIQAIQNLEILYEIDEVELTDSNGIGDDYKTLVIIDPKDSIPLSHIQHIDNFFNSGRNVYIATSRIDADLQTAYAKSKSTGLEIWLKDKGVIIEDNIVRDVDCGSVTVQQRAGFMSFNSQVKFPYFPIISNFTEHPITSGLEAIVLPFTNALSFSGIDTSKVKIYPLALSSAKSGVEKPPFYIDISKNWTEVDFTLGSLPIAVALDGQISGENNSRLVVIGNGNFAVNGEGQKAQRVHPDNVNIMVNAIDWLSDDTGLIELRTKGITSRPLEQLEDDTKTMIKYTNVFAPIILILIYGLFRYQMQSRKRKRWMEDNY
ncbi:MAG: Gldg family protein [Bacteroidia bacterium]|nr:Gldg family protein [Bacteroidia bacterium]